VVDEFQKDEDGDDAQPHLDVPGKFPHLAVDEDTATRELGRVKHNGAEAAHMHGRAKLAL
jgi:hypothetical protein